MAVKKSDFDGDGIAEVPVTSPWGIGILKLSGNTLSAPMTAPNGTRFGGWLLNISGVNAVHEPDSPLKRRLETR